MHSFISASEAVTALHDFLYDRDEALPADVRELLKTWAGPNTPSIRGVKDAAELIYARRAELGPEAMELGAALALICEQYNFSGMATDHRGSRMAMTLMREAGSERPAILGEYPDESQDVPAADRFVPVEEELPAPMEVVVDVAAATPADAVAPAEGARRGRGHRERKANNTA